MRCWCFLQRLDDIAYRNRPRPHRISDHEQRLQVTHAKAESPTSQEIPGLATHDDILGDILADIPRDVLHGNRCTYGLVSRSTIRSPAPTTNR